MNGKHGDHPISDIIDHGLRVYGEPTDGDVRKLGRLMDRHRLFAWFEDLPLSAPEEVAKAIATKLSELEKHAKASGWEIDT